MTQGDASNSFAHGAQFAEVAASGNLRVGKLEAMYEELFAEVLEDGVITADERRQLDKMADNLGLDRERLRKLEAAFQAAYEARHRIRVRVLDADGDMSEPMSTASPRESIAPFMAGDSIRTQSLEKRIDYLEARVRELEAELADARAHVNVEVDLSDFGTDSTSTLGPEEDPNELSRRVRHDPRDVDSLRSLFRHYGRVQDNERRFHCANVLEYLKAATVEEQDFQRSHRIDGLMKPTQALSPEAWRKLLFHPEEETVVGDVFSVVASAVLMGRLAAMRRDKVAQKLDESKKQDPKVSTLQAVRCFSWAASILGMHAPSLYADGNSDVVVDVVLVLPPMSLLGKGALSGRSAPELAFLAGRHLGQLREEHFVKTVFQDVKGLEDVFLASLVVGNPGLPLSQNVKQLVVPIAKAIEPLLEPSQIDRLRGHFLRFVEEGGRTNLQRWSQSVDFTCNRTGLLLSGDLGAAERMLKLVDPRHADVAMDDLLVFAMSDRYVKLRKQLGVALKD
jgi:hypothetical protein